MSKLVAGNWKMFGDKNMISEIKKSISTAMRLGVKLQYAPPFH